MILPMRLCGYQHFPEQIRAASAQSRNKSIPSFLQKLIFQPEPLFRIFAFLI